MKNLKILLILIFLMLIIVPAQAKQPTIDANKLEYINLDWWKKFNDEKLNNYLLLLYENNKDLKIATASTKQAQQVVKMAFANQLPQLTISASGGREFSSSTIKFGDVVIPDYAQSRFLLPLSMTYEIDIWGENYLKTKSVKQKLEMIKQDERASYISITSAFASNYFNLIKADKLINNQEKLVSIQEKIVELYKKKHEGGLCPLSDLLNQKQLLTIYKEDLNKLKETQDVLENQLKVILGDRNLVDIERSNYENLKIIELPNDINTDAIRNRPDLIKVESYINKIGLDVKVARREFLPKFIIYGQVGFNAYDFSKLFSGHSFLSNAGLLPSFDVFSGGRKIAMLKYQKYEYEKALQIYEKTILTSIQEVNDAMMSSKVADKNFKTSIERFNLEQDKYNLSEKKYEIGALSKLEKLEAQEAVILSEKASISNKIDTIVSAINVYKSIGGVDYTAYEESI